MFINKKYIIRHKILKTLQEKQSPFDNQEHLNNEDVEMTFQELMNGSGLSEKEINQQIDYLLEIEEIYLDWRQGVQYFFILNKGTISYFDNKYLYERRKEFLNDTYDVIKTISAVMLLIIAVITFIVNLIATRKNKKDIEKIKTELRQIKDTTHNFKPIK